MKDRLQTAKRLVRFENSYYLLVLLNRYELTKALLAHHDLALYPRTWCGKHWVDVGSVT